MIFFNIAAKGLWVSLPKGHTFSIKILNWTSPRKYPRETRTLELTILEISSLSQSHFVWGRMQVWAQTPKAWTHIHTNVKWPYPTFFQTQASKWESDVAHCLEMKVLHWLAAILKHAYSFQRWWPIDINVPKCYLTQI